MTLLGIGGARRRGFPLPAPGTLNTIPTYEGSGQTIHPSVVDMGQRWGGYRWWLADTPYPGQNDNYENASIFASNDRITWVVPSGVTNPIAAPPADLSKWNSDTELVWDPDNARMVMFWRSNYVAEYLHAVVSTDGHTWTTVDPPPLTYASGPWMSPTIERADDGTWWQMDFNAGANSPGMRTAPSALGTRTYQGAITLQGTNVYEFDKWHGSMCRYGDMWIALVSARAGNTRPMVATSGMMTWRLGDTDIAGMSAYRATMTPSTEAGYLDVWYSNISTLRVTYTRIHESVFLDLIP